MRDYTTLVLEKEEVEVIKKSLTLTRAIANEMSNDEDYRLDDTSELDEKSDFLNEDPASYYDQIKDILDNHFGGKESD